MKTFYKRFIAGFLLLLLCAATSTVSAQTEKRIAEIQNIDAETNAKIAECEENGEYSSTFLSETVVNKNNGSYPAVGIFKSVYKFYYAFGDREKNPYPNRLLKIVIETKRSANTEKYEFLFDQSGQLIFYFESKNEAEKTKERRIYFAAEKPLRILDDEKSINLKSREAVSAVKAVLGEKRKLAVMFENSLNY